MRVAVTFTRDPIAPMIWIDPEDGGEVGAQVEFRGLVRCSEEGRKIMGLEYEAYEGMAVRVMQDKIQTLQARFPCATITVIHRLGRVPVGEAAIAIGLQSRHRGPANDFLRHFMDELKRDVPIWKKAF